MCHQSETRFPFFPTIVYLFKGPLSSSSLSSSSWGSHWQLIWFSAVGYCCCCLPFNCGHDWALNSWPKTRKSFTIFLHSSDRDRRWRVRFVARSLCLCLSCVRFDFWSVSLGPRNFHAFGSSVGNIKQIFV